MVLCMNRVFVWVVKCKGKFWICLCISFYFFILVIGGSLFSGLGIYVGFSWVFNCFCCISDLVLNFSFWVGVVVWSGVFIIFEVVGGGG